MLYITISVIAVLVLIIIYLLFLKYKNKNNITKTDFQVVPGDGSYFYGPQIKYIKIISRIRGGYYYDQIKFLGVDNKTYILKDDDLINMITRRSNKYEFEANLE